MYKDRKTILIEMSLLQKKPRYVCLKNHTKADLLTLSGCD